MLVFTRPKTKNIYEPREKVIRYSYRIEKDGELKYQYRKQEDYCKNCFIIEDVNKKYGNTVIIVTHNDAIQNMADRVIKLRDGEIMDNIVNKDKIDARNLEW